MIIDGIKLAGMAIGGIRDYFIGSQEIRKAKEEGVIAVIKADANQKIAVSQAKMRMAESGQTDDYNLDRIAMTNMKTSYKDEIVLFIFLAPMIAAFFPGYAGYVEKGFSVIANTMPDWYMYLIVGMVVVIYGMRGMLTKAVDGRFAFFNKGKPSGK